MKGIVALSVVAMASLALTAGAAEVNCNQVNKYLKTGRTPEDVADTMVVSIDDVKKCQQQEGKSAGGSAPPAGGSTTSGTGSTAKPDGSQH